MTSDSWGRACVGLPEQAGAALLLAHDSADELNDLRAVRQRQHVG